MTRARSLKRVVVCAAGGALVIVLLGVAPAYAGSVWWGLTSGSWPTSLSPGGAGRIVVTAENLGYENADGSPMVLKDILPEGLEVREDKTGGKDVPEIEGVAGEESGFVNNRGLVQCSLLSSREVECEFNGTLPPFEELEVRIGVVVGESVASGEENDVTVSGSGASRALARPIDVGERSGFGVEDYELLSEDEGGAFSAQAGGHPFQLTSVLTLNTSEAAAESKNQEPAGLAKDLTFQLPPGLVGNPTSVPQCTDAEFSKQEAGAEHNECAPQTAIGVVTVTTDTSEGGLLNTMTAPLFNLQPQTGEPARFGFEIKGFSAIIDTSVRTGSDYGVTARVSNITEVPGFLTSKVTFWGVPGDPRHDRVRGWDCLEEKASCIPLDETNPPPFLSMPTRCNGPLHTAVEADSWAEPKPVPPLKAPLLVEYTMGELDGCNQLQFNPEVSVTPDVMDANSPSGLTVGIHISQEAALNPEGLAESALKELTLRLPEGMSVNPASADGLEACSESEIGYLPEQSTPENLQFTPEEPSCPDASKVGQLEIETPLLPHALKGFVYLASPAPFGEPGLLGETGLNPFGTLLTLYIVVEDPVSGTLIKLPVKVSLDPSTGRLIATSPGIPDLPFENLRLHMFGEDRAPLGTPPLCGPYTTGASFAPWSGNEPSQVSSTFSITSAPNGGPCRNPLPFAPSLTAGTTSIQAGGFSSFTMTMSREDGNQNLKAIALHMPPGLSGTLSGVMLCGEAQSDAGTCGPESLIGETTVSVGLGNSPYTVTGGRVYLTGPYEGAPFGLSIVNPADAGPFHLGNVIVRARIEVDPHTAQLTVTSDASGPYAIPPMIKGIPLQIKHINVTIDRPAFTFNPTNCNPQAITGTLTSIEEATFPLSVPFQVTNCAVLAFKPTFKVSTSGRTSRADGANLKVKLTYPKAPQGSEANIAKVKVDLPKQLPSRLTTLQKACTARTFEANRANCPAASIVGQAKAITPILPVPLEGPAYFVSHGGEAFPSLIVVLHGYGVSVDLVGTTFISKAGVTSSTFKTVPDVPVGSFELNLPQGKFSALTAIGNLCTSKLAMPTAFVAQNGVEIHESTPISVTGCAKARTLSRAQKLAAALRACRKKARGNKRTVCEGQARERYGKIKKAQAEHARRK